MEMMLRKVRGIVRESREFGDMTDDEVDKMINELSSQFGLFQINYRIVETIYVDIELEEEVGH